LASNNNIEIQPRRIILVGAMGVGKTRVGTLISEILGWPYIDNDYEMSKMASLSMKELAKLDVPTLHGLEEKYLWDVLLRPAPLLAGAAASVADNEDLVKALAKECTIYLHMPLELQKQRAGTSGVGRQAFVENPHEVIRERYERRDPRYRQAASLVVDTIRNPEKDSQIILDFLRS